MIYLIILFNIKMEGGKTEKLDKENQIMKESDLNTKQIYKSEDFKKEFDELLEKINEDDQNDNNEMYNSPIDLDFLKNDYLELYDIKKLLNEPKYYLAKFKIQFFDFINLTNYFYKVLDKEDAKKIVKNNTIKNNINISNNNDNNNSPVPAENKDKKKKPKRKKGIKKMKSFNPNRKDYEHGINLKINKRLKSEPKKRRKKITDFLKFSESIKSNNNSRIIEIKKEKTLLVIQAKK